MDPVTEIPVPNINYRKLRGQLAENRMSIRAFAERAGITREYLSDLMLGKYRPGTAAKLRIAYTADALGFEGVVSYPQESTTEQLA